MSDDKAKADADRWARLAAELGLQPDLPPEPAPEPVRPPEPEVAQHEEMAAPVEAPLMPEPDKWQEPIVAAPAEEMAAFAAPPEGRGEQEAGDEEGPGRRGRGRRRRGRGRGERRPAETETSPEPEPLDAAVRIPEALPEAEQPAQADAEESDVGERDGGRRRRRRRRRRKPDEASAGVEEADELDEAPTRREADEVEDEDEAEEPEEMPVPVAAADDDDEPEEDFSDWSVPSWNELIASLYRPER